MRYLVLPALMLSVFLSGCPSGDAGKAPAAAVPAGVKPWRGSSLDGLPLARVKTNLAAAGWKLDVDDTSAAAKAGTSFTLYMTRKIGNTDVEGHFFYEAAPHAEGAQAAAVALFTANQIGKNYSGEAFHGDRAAVLFRVPTMSEGDVKRHYSPSDTAYEKVIEELVR